MRGPAAPGSRRDGYSVVYCGRCEAVGPTDHTCVPEPPYSPSRRGESVPPALSVSTDPDSREPGLFHSAERRAPLPSETQLPPGTNVFDYQDNQIPDDIFYSSPALVLHSPYWVGDPGTQDSLGGVWPRAVSEYSRNEAGPSQKQASHRNPPLSYSGGTAPGGRTSCHERPPSYRPETSAVPPRYTSVPPATMYRAPMVDWPFQYSLDP